MICLSVKQFGILCAFCTCILIFLLQVWEVLSHNFLKYIFNPLLSSFGIHKWKCQNPYYYARYQIAFIFKKFSFCYPDCVISIILSFRSLAYSSVSLSMLFMFLVYLFQLLFISEWVSFIFASSLLEKYFDQLFSLVNNFINDFWLAVSSSIYYQCFAFFSW